MDVHIIISYPIQAVVSPSYFSDLLYVTVTICTTSYADRHEHVNTFLYII